MTTPILKENDAVAFLGLTPQNALNVLQQLKDKLLFTTHASHSSEGPPHGQVFVATTKAIFPGMDTAILPRIPSDATVQQNGSITLVSTGVAKRKRQATTLAAVDLILQLQECGINVLDPPNASEFKKRRAKQDLQEGMARAQMLLELLGSSKPRFEIYQIQNRPVLYEAKVSMYVDGGKYLNATGPPCTSKAEAEARALVAASQGWELQQLVGQARLETCLQLIDESPSKHVAALRIPPLPNDALDMLIDAMGSPQEFDARIRDTELQQERFEEHFRKRELARWRHEMDNPAAGASTRGNHGKLKQLNEAFQKEEADRLQTTLQDPEGPQGAIQTVRENLPILAIRNEFLEALQTNQVVVVSGGTGSGKSTQCPQYILENAIAKDMGAETRIVVTQPRRIAAISVAERVANERDERIGNSVGYVVRHQQVPPRSVGSIEFVTTGVLLRRLLTDPSLSGISHVVIDEVHERDIDTDFLLILLRDLLTRRPDLRVVLMSATLDAESFGKYFESIRRDDEGRLTPVMSVPTKPRYPVEVIHLEDVAGETVPVTNDDTTTPSLSNLPADLQRLAASLLQAQDEQLQLELEEADAEEEAASEIEALSVAEDRGEALEAEAANKFFGGRSPSARIRKLRRALSMRNKPPVDTSSRVRHATKMGRPTKTRREVDEIAANLMANLAMHVSRTETDAGRKGSILCFLPGWDEIKAVMTLLEESDEDVRSIMNIFPLHSSIPQEEQQAIFNPAADGTVKVILATNIAESSVTIDDVLAVIDGGLVREMNWNAESGMSAMETVATSKASATQRLGRAGRVAPGKCYRLYSRGALEAMPERATPEMQRTALEATCLQTCNMTRAGVQNFLSRAMDPPPEESVTSAMDRLVKLDAIRIDPEGERLSPLGRLLSRLPVDPAMGRMLLLACTMQCLDPILSVAAFSGSRDVFYTPPGMRDEARNIRQSFCDYSDLLAKLRAYDEFQHIKETHGWNEARQWASENFVSIAAMNSIQSIRGQLLRELNRIGLVPNSDLAQVRSRTRVLHPNATVNQNSDIEPLYTAVLTTGFPGNLAARRELAHFGTLRTRMENHAGLHPSSVAFHRKPPKDTYLPKWFLYKEMVLSSQVFLRECTDLNPYQIMLFGGESLRETRRTPDGRVDSNEDDGVEGQTVIDEWIVVESSCGDTVDVLSDIRRGINAALTFKVMSPRRPLDADKQVIVDAVASLCDELDDPSEG